MNPAEYDLLIKSLSFIQHNPDISATQIPDELLKFWCIPGLPEKRHCEVKEPQLLVFMQILKLHSYSLNEVEDVLNWFYFYQLFYSFQLILSVTLYCREHAIPLAPFPVFHIEQYVIPDLGNIDELMDQYGKITKNKLP